MEYSNRKMIRTMTFFLFIVYITLLVKLILFKNFDYRIPSYHFLIPANISLKASFHRANFVPFATCYYYLSGQEHFETGMENLGGNIILFIPYGFLLPVLLNKAGILKKTLRAVMLTSIAFELMQLVLDNGNCDIDDVLLNTLGGGMGYFGFLCVFYLVRQKWKKITPLNYTDRTSG
jgi:glycopeptide antibiotics resistance protein